MNRRALAPLAWTYGALVACRRQAYRRGLLRQRRVNAPVISVGSLSMGGSGKTPIARIIAERIADRGRAVAVVCGAYTGLARGTTSVVAPDDRLAAQLFGDEAALLARWLAPVPVVAGRDKLAAARLAVERGAEVVVVDDGFQHQRLARDMDLLVFDRDPTPAVVPLGPGRERPSALSCADLLWLHLRDGRLDSPRVNTSPDVVSRNCPAGLVTAAGRVLPLSQLKGARVTLMAGIAAPGGFRTIVESLGARVVSEVFVRDHRPFSHRHFRRAAARRADLLLCTEKDLARMAFRPGGSALIALVCQTEVLSGSRRLETAISATLEGRR